jgi:hypothetical protein
LDPAATSEQVLLRNAALTLRTIFSLGTNYLNMLKLDGTALQQLTGKMEVIPFLGGSFNTYAQAQWN